MTLPGKTRAPQSKTPKYRVDKADTHPRQFNIDRYDDELKMWRYVGLIRADDDVVAVICRLLNQSSGRKGTN